MDVKKIPILGDLDFSDPVKRKSSIRIVAAMVMVLIVLFMIILKKATAETPEQEPQESSYESVEIPMGKDNDQLKGKTMRDVSQGRRGRAGAFAEDLFSSEQAADDPLAALSGKTEDNQPSTQENSNLPSFMRTGGNQNVYPDLTRASEQNEGEKETRTDQPRAGKQKPSAKGGSAGRQESEQDIRRRRLYEEYGLDPETGRPKNSGEQQASPKPSFTQEGSASASASSTAVATESEKEPEPAIEPVKVQVRRSGGVSSFGTSGTELSNLGEMDEYITDDPSHPFKVKFAYDEKVSSGKRVTIRLCEDMVVDGVLIPVNTHLFATCQVGERLKLNVSSIDIGGKIYTLNYSAYDNDGVEGLYCPQSEAGKIAKEVGEQAGQIAQSAIGAALSGYPSRIFQAGAQAVRSKGGKTTVSVTAGYTFYLIKAR